MEGGTYPVSNDLKRILLSFAPSYYPAVCHDTSLWGTERGVHYLSQSAGKEYTKEMKMDEKGYRNLFTELEDYERRGVDISLDGYRASPLQIVTAHMTKEEGTYMRDYVMSREGYITSLAFTDIHIYGRKRIPLKYRKDGGCI